MPDQTGQDCPPAAAGGRHGFTEIFTLLSSIPPELADTLTEAALTLESVTLELADACQRESALLTEVERWAEQAGSDLLAPAARVTYVKCAEAVARIFA